MNWDTIGTFLWNLGQTVGLKLLYAAILLVVGLKLIKWFLKMLSKGRAFSRLDSGIQSFAKSFLRIVLDVLLFLSIASILGVPTTSFITMLASAGVAIGLALQGALSNFAGGLMLLFFRPFHTGDLVEVGSTLGTVQGITVFYTTLLTPDGKKVTIPNGTLTSANITDYSTEGGRRVDLTFSVAYSSDMEQVKRLLREVADNEPLVRQEPEPLIRLMTQNASSLDFTLWVWCGCEDYWTVYFNLTEQVKKTFDANGISIPFPQMDVHVNPEN